MKACFLLLLLAAPASSGPLEDAASASGAASEARELDDAAGGARAPFAGGELPEPLRVQAAGRKAAPAVVPPMTVRIDAPVPPGPSYAQIRREREGLSWAKAGRGLRSAGYAAAGFTVGVLAGWAIGAVGAGVFVAKSPNPTVRKWSPLLMVPAVVAGAVVGAIAMPFLLGYWFGSSQPYPAKGTPENPKFNEE